MSPFMVGDIVETIKGARFWGKVVSVYEVTSFADLGQTVEVYSWRIDVQAIHPDFLGTIHVYPATQLQIREPNP